MSSSTGQTASEAGAAAASSELPRHPLVVERDGLVRIRRAGPVDLSDLHPTLPDLLEAHPDRRRFRLLLDYREAVFTHLTQAEIHALVSQDRVVMTQVDSIRMAIVVESDVAFGIARMYASLTMGSEIEIEVFRDLKEAERWLPALPA
ncbi:MAG: hypothetical protein AAGC67_11240 [Myxococcota bacterium]